MRPGTVAFHNRFQSRGQFLAQLNAPLIKGIDPKDHPFDKDPVFIECNQLPKAKGREFGIDQRCGRSVAFKNPMPGLALQFRALKPLGLCDLQRRGQVPPKHQCLRLRQTIGLKQVVLMRQLRLVALFGQYEFARNDMLALVDQLIEGMLPICARLASNNWPGGIQEILAVNPHALTVGFHFKLL